MTKRLPRKYVRLALETASKRLANRDMPSTFAGCRYHIHSRPLRCYKKINAGRKSRSESIEQNEEAVGMSIAKDRDSSENKTNSRGIDAGECTGLVGYDDVDVQEKIRVDPAETTEPWKQDSTTNALASRYYEKQQALIGTHVQPIEVPGINQNTSLGTRAILSGTNDMLRQAGDPSMNAPIVVDVTEVTPRILTNGNTQRRINDWEKRVKANGGSSHSTTICGSPSISNDSSKDGLTNEEMLPVNEVRVHGALSSANMAELVERKGDTPTPRISDDSSSSCASIEIRPTCPRKRSALSGQMLPTMDGRRRSEESACEIYAVPGAYPCS